VSALSSDELGERLIEFIEREVALEEDPIDLDTDLLLSGLVDSMGVIMVVNWMSDELGIAIDAVDVVLENFQSVRDMVAYAQRRGAVDVD
jgi:acyl carrier protein